VTKTPERADTFLTIGVFARRSRLSMKALRLYDRLELLIPADVDRENGYRRYRESQLATARMIVMLRRLDMPLTQVAEIISAPGPEAARLVAVLVWVLLWWITEPVPIPVTALLALAGGGYAVEVPDGAATKLVAVETGLFADGYVEVSGVEAGVEVVVPS